jgi:hydroxyacylglutathione hydrolase
VEKLTNPFLRWEEPSLQATAKSKEGVQTFARIRGMKDNF